MSDTVAILVKARGHLCPKAHRAMGPGAMAARLAHMVSERVLVDAGVVVDIPWDAFSGPPTIPH